MNDVHLAIPRTISSKKATLMSISRQQTEPSMVQTHNNRVRTTVKGCGPSVLSLSSPDYWFSETASRKNGAWLHYYFPPGGEGRTDGGKEVLIFYKAKEKKRKQKQKLKKTKTKTGFLWWRREGTVEKAGRETFLCTLTFFRF